MNGERTGTPDVAKIGIEASDTQAAAVKFWGMMDSFKYSKVNKIISIKSL